MRSQWTLSVLVAIAFGCAPGPAAAQDELQNAYAEAQQAQAAGNLARAAAKYEQIVRLRPEMAEAYANLGNLYYQQAEMARAKAAYTTAARLKPTLGGPQFFLGVIAFGERDYTSALRHLQRAQSLQPENPLVYGYLGYTAYARNDFRGAANEFEKAMALAEADIDVLYHLSKCYGHLAGQSFAQLKNRYPDSVWTYLARAHAFETQEDWKAAGQQYALALQRMPDNSSLQQKVRAMARASEARASEARASEEEAAGDGGVTAAAADDPSIEGALAFKDRQLSGAQLHDEIAKWQASVRGVDKETAGDKQIYRIAEAYRVLSYLVTVKLVGADPNSYRAHQIQAQSFEASGKDEEAIREYQKALEEKRDLQNIHFAIGSLFWKAQSFDAARVELEQELKLNPNHPQALYELGDMAAFNGDSARAEKLFLAALKLDSSLVEAHLALEKLYSQNGRFELSVEHLKSVLALDPAEARVHYRLAAIYRKQGRTADADREIALFNRQPAAGSASRSTARPAAGKEP